jgi:hypothetical protein
MREARGSAPHVYSKLTAGVTGVLTAVVALAVMYQLGSNRYPAGYARAVGPDVLAQMKGRLLMADVPGAVRVGLACAFLVLVGRSAVGLGQFDRLARATIAGITWILIESFVQTVLLYLHANVSSVMANLFWSGTWLLSIIAVTAFVLRTLTRPGDLPSI